MTADVEAGQAVPEETKALTEEKVPEVKITTNLSKQEHVGKVEEEFKGLTKEELMKYATDPFWVKLRWALFILFWIVWVAMLAAAVVIIVFAPKCPSPDPKEWWQKGPIYRVDIATFRDSDGNGKGDIKGLMSELGYLVDVGIGTLHLAPFYKGTNEGDEYGVVDYLDVDPELGSLDDWNILVKELQDRNIKVLLDFLPERTSVQAEWFEKSTAQDPVYSDFYLWASTGGPGWVSQADRGQHYFTGQGKLPRLNLNNDKVLTELEKILVFWVGRGADGFNLVLSGEDTAAEEKLVRRVRSVLDSSEPHQILISMTDKTVAEVAPLYGENINDNHVGEKFALASAMPLTRELASGGGADVTTAKLVEFINVLRTGLPANAWPTLTLSDVQQRVAGLAPDLVDGLNMLTVLLPATPYFNAGDELGMASGDMNWEIQKNQTQAASEGRLTHFSVFSMLSPLRHQEAILFGNVAVEDMSGCLVLTRVKKGNPGYLLLMNLNHEETTLDLSALANMADNVRILVGSITGAEFSLPDPEQTKAFPANQVQLQARQAVIYTFVPKF